MRNSWSTPRTLILLSRSQLTCSSAMQMTHKGEGKAPKMCVIMQEEGKAETGEEQSQQSQQQLPSRMPRNAQAASDRERAAERSVSVRSHLSRAAAHTLSRSASATTAEQLCALIRKRNNAASAAAATTTNNYNKQ